MVWGKFWSERRAGEWIWRRRLLFHERVPVFTFRNDQADPLSVAFKGAVWRPNRTFSRFDFMSVPLALQGRISPLMSPEGGAVHDSGYEFHGLWEVCGELETFRHLPRLFLDELLQAVVRSSHGKAAADQVFLAVRVGGAKAWERQLELNGGRRGTLKRGL